MTKIEWTDATWNPTTGCSWASSGCDHCYAFTMSRRLAAMGQEKYQGVTGRGHFNGVLSLHESTLDLPFRWQKPKRVFVNSMSDLFHPEVPFEFVDRVFAVMALCPQHTFQILTKRPERMAEYLNAEFRANHVLKAMITLTPKRGVWAWPTWTVAMKRVWLGTSCEDQDTADERVTHLLQCPAAVRFLSCEPLLGPIDLATDVTICDYCGRYTLDKKSWECACGKPLIQDAYTIAERIDWVIAGGESGPGARPCHPDWARSLRDQCQAAGVPFFWKQWGEWSPDGNPFDHHCRTLRFDGRLYDPHTQREHVTDAAEVYRVGKKRAGRVLDGREWSEFPKARSC